MVFAYDFYMGNQEASSYKLFSIKEKSKFSR